MAVSFALSNADFPPLFTVSKLHLTFINAFFDRHISNTTTVKPFSRTVLRCSLLLRTNLCANCYVTHHLSLNLFRLKDILLIVLCKSLSRDPISVVSPVDAINVNAKFTPLRSRVHLVKSHFRPMRVSVLKAPTIFTINTASPPNVCNVVSRINPTHHLCEAPQYIHTVVVNNPANTSYSRHERISCFFNQVQVLHPPL